LPLSIKIAIIFMESGSSACKMARRSRYCFEKIEKITLLSSFGDSRLKRGERFKPEMEPGNPPGAGHPFLILPKGIFFRGRG
jgi:hypothetical protein